MKRAAGRVMGSLTGDKYAQFTRGQLVERIRELENANDRHSARMDVRPFDFSKHAVRPMAFKFTYLGWSYNGLVVQEQPTPLPTVEAKIFEALQTARLIESPETCNFSRCGRTDKGVSAFGQVISLRVRCSKPETPDVPYLTALNRLLPSNIRFLAQAEVDETFSARFNCQKRHYKYFFVSNGLDIERMREAAKMYEGEHDFRNFCKLDASKQISNFKRTMYRSDIYHETGDLFYFDLKGSAFLWHQVRCMMAVLFLVGQGHEDPMVVRELLCVEKNPTRPVYDVAHDAPLVLWDCIYDDSIQWQWDKDTGREALVRSVFETWHTHKLRETLASNLLRKIIGASDQETASYFAGRTRDRNVSRVVDGSARLRVFKKYVPLMSRKRTEDIDVLNERYRSKKAVAAIQSQGPTTFEENTED